MSKALVAGLILAEDGSPTVGRPKPLLPYAGTTLLGHALAAARACELDQLLVAADNPDKVRERIDLSGVELVASVAEAIDALQPATSVLVLFRGDQPGVEPATVRFLLAVRGDAPVAVCRYDDGRGHPYAVSRELFAELRARAPIEWLVDVPDAAEVPVAGSVPRDVDTWADYEAVVAAGSRRGLRD